MYSTSSDTNVTQLTVLRQRCTFSETEVYIDVYRGDDNFATSGAMLVSDLDLQETYRAIDSVATGRIPSLSCGSSFFSKLKRSRVTLLRGCHSFSQTQVHFLKKLFYYFLLGQGLLH